MNNFRKRLGRIIYSWQFEYTFLFLIALNGIVIGFEMEYVTQNLAPRPPHAYELADHIFITVFTLEVMVHIFVSREHFFKGPGCQLNIFDLVVVIVQVLGFFITAFLDAQINNVHVLRLVRLIRIVRVVRTVRVLKAMGEVRAIIWAVVSSLKPLGGAIAILAFLNYLLAIYFTDMALGFRIELDRDDPINEEFTPYYGTLAGCMFSLWQAISGGIDWHEMSRPLVEHISPWMALIFSFYIAFALLALMNTITGVFIDIALRNGRRNEEDYMMNYIRKAFVNMDVEADGLVTWEEFEIGLTNNNLEELFSMIGLDVSEARSMFELIDLNGDGSIATEEFLAGCLRLRGDAKALDMLVFMRESKRMFDQVFLALDQLYEVATKPGGTHTVD